MAKLHKFWKEWGRTFLALSGISVLALILRIYKLTYLPIFGDEAIYIRWAQVMQAVPSLRFIPLTDGKQPLFMWVVIPFLKLFSDPLFAGRLVSVLTGLGSLVGIFVLSYILFCHSGAKAIESQKNGRSYRSQSSLQDDRKNARKVALVSSFIYAISPYSVFYDRLALADSMLCVFGVWTFVFAVITVKKVRLDSAMLSGFFLGGALLTKSPATFFSLLTPVTLLLKKWPKKFKQKFGCLSIYIFLFTFTFLIAYGMYNILRLGENFHMIGTRNKDYIYPLTHILKSPLDPLLPFLHRSLQWFWKLGPSTFVFLVILGIWVGLKKHKRETIILCALVFIPLLVSAEYAKTFTARYIFYIFPYLVTLAGLAFGEARNGGRIVKLLLIIFIFHAIFINFQLLTNIKAAPLPRVVRSGYLEEWTSGTGIREVADYLRLEVENLPAGRQVVVGTEGYFGTLPDGLQIYLNDLPEITVIGTGLDFKEIPVQLIESKQAGNKTYFVVNSTRLLEHPEKLNLELIAQYPKAIRPDGSRESLYFFEVVDVEINSL